uniref:Uncharacterized protein n=1 Tax=Oryza brachyantha TaxID=4533 RepID=J3MKF9_ORYBR
MEDQYTDLSGCTIGEFSIRYQGIPIHFRKLRNADWKRVEERFEKNLSSWKDYFQDYSLAPYMGYPPEARIMEYSAYGVSTIGAGGHEVFYPGLWVTI